MTTLIELEQYFETNTNISTMDPCFMLRRTPRRKLVFSSSDDETDNSPKSISSVHILRQEYQDEQSTVRSEISETIRTKSSRSKLEHYGFQQLPRPISALREQSKAQFENKSKRLGAVNITPIINQSSRHPMQTRSQSSTDSHSEQLIKRFDESLSTVTPNRDNKENEVSSQRYRTRRPRPLPLCLSENEKNLPVLTVITAEENSNTNKRIHDDDEGDDNSDMKRTKLHNEDKTIINRPSTIKRSRCGISLVRSSTEPSEEQIRASVELGSNRDLIGDRSRTYLLPRCKSRKHPDLACISPQTMIDVLRGAYSSEVEQLHIIDCRYPYEYEGGHIQSAKNLYTKAQILDQYFRQIIQLNDPTKRNIFIFHCEFSSERAPTLLRYFRSEDRTIHERTYPQLHYPELYLLEGGYKAFFEHSQEFCLPKQYRTMLDVDYHLAYREYRSETKQNEKTGCVGGRRTRTSNFRSCFSFSSQTSSHRSTNIRYDLRYTSSSPDH